MAEPLQVRTHALLLGSGLIFASGALLGLTLPMRAALEGFPTYLIGFIGSAFAAGFEPFAIVAILACLALIPTALSSGRAPEPLHEVRLNFRRLIRLSPIAVVACFGIGLANGAFGTLAPIFAQGIGMPVAGVAFLVAGAIVGGAVMQAPVGRLSDRMDRRQLLVGIALAGTMLSLGMFLVDLREPAVVIVVVAVLGGAMHTLYPVAVAHANDRAEKGDFVVVASSLLLIFGGGATFGPAIAAPLMQLGGPRWLFLFLAVVYAVVALHGVWRIHVAPPAEESEHAYIALEPMQSATQEAMYLDPRADEEHA